MAANIFTGAINANTNNAGNWSLLSIPTFSDGNVATWGATSPNCTVNATLSCNAVDFTGYTAKAVKKLRTSITLLTFISSGNLAVLYF